MRGLGAQLAYPCPVEEGLQFGDLRGHLTGTMLRVIDRSVVNRMDEVWHLREVDDPGFYTRVLLDALHD